MEEYIVRWVMCGVISWSAAFMAVRKALPNRSFDFCSRIISTAHACVAVVLATLSFRTGHAPSAPRLSLLPLAVTLSYLIYDFFCILLDKRINISDLVHHAVGIVGIIAGLAYQMCGTEMVTTMWITEVSTPFLHLRQFLKELGYKDTDLNLLADNGLWPYMTTVTLTADYPFLIKAMALGLQLVSAFWFFKILRLMRLKMKSRRNPKAAADGLCPPLKVD
ncbi:unnamed protein product [Spirodela intermedia]|uniref:TLC domain-containing protein n=1 Tax=Spirodela intermedia TaxID=51605 RepID=A0A7I8JMS5_SPIIN|nr:unnamed protein product [Spirodela intermedia]CAA6671467.1 unnamed protein product [Spirodela intermedia]